jgi:meso-butanediol dehydrogenase/(S,S)-butanediol dehydrogenase/diacetyl reductase
LLSWVELKLQGKVAIITGATDGIGKATALKFASEGAKVIMVGRSEARGRSAEAEVRKLGDAHYIQADVSDSLQVKQFTEETIKRYGRIDVLVNNAAMVHAGTILTTSEEKWDEIIDINLKGVFLCCKYVIPHMQKNGGGVIVNMGSINSMMAMENEAVYDTSKGGVLMLTKAIALDFAKSNIRANCILPGAVETTMLNASLNAASDPTQAREWTIQRHPVRRFGRPEEIAEVILFLAADAPPFMTGAVIPVDGGILAGWV